MKILSIMAILSLFAAAAIWGQELTKEDVVFLVEIGSPEAEIIAQIESSGAKFSLTAEEVKEMEAQGISRNILKAMGVEFETAQLTADAVAGWLTDKVPEGEILERIERARSVPDYTSQDWLKLKRAGVSPAITQAIKARMAQKDVPPGELEIAQLTSDAVAGWLADKVPEGEILKRIERARSVPDYTSQDWLKLKRAGVSPAITQAIKARTQVTGEPGDNKTVRFIYQAPVEGTTIIENQAGNQNMAISIKQDGNLLQKLDQKQSQIHRKKITILGVKDNIITKLRVQYEEAKTVQDNQTQKAAVHGKTYIVESKGAKVSIADEKGKTPAAGELEVLKEEFKNFGRIDPMVEFLQGKTLKIGEKIDMPPALAQEIMGEIGKGDVKLEEFTWVLQGQREAGGFPCAVLGMAVKLSAKLNEGELPGAEITVDMKGEFVLGTKNCLPVSLTSKGPLTLYYAVDQNESKIVLEGKGEMSYQVSAQYNPPSDRGEDTADPGHVEDDPLQSGEEPTRIGSLEFQVPKGWNYDPQNLCWVAPEGMESGGFFAWMGPAEKVGGDAKDQFATFHKQMESQIKTVKKSTPKPMSVCEGISAVNLKREISFAGNRMYSYEVIFVLQDGVYYLLVAAPSQQKIQNLVSGDIQAMINSVRVVDSNN